MDSFAQNIAAWHDFYMLVGTAAATLLGLLFVGLSLNLDTIRRTENVGLNALATQSFGLFLYVLFIAMTFLIPDQGPRGIGIPLLAMGLFGSFKSGRYLVGALRHRNRLEGATMIFWRHFLPTLSFVFLVVIAILAWQGNTDILHGMIAIIIILLLTATRNSWDLLVRAHE